MPETPGLIAVPTPEDYLETIGASPASEFRRSEIKGQLPEIDMEQCPEALGWRVLVLPPASPEKTEAGIALVKQSVSALTAMQRIGVVISIGPLAYSTARGFVDYHPIEVGDWVGFNENAGVDLFMQSKTGRLVKIKALSEGDLLAKIKNPSDFTVVM